MNTEGKPQVDHIDQTMHHNTVENFQCFTVSEINSIKNIL